MSRTRRIGLALALLLAAVGGWALLRVLPEKEDATWTRIVETGVLPVCTDPSWPPFEVWNEASGRIEGFDADLARELARRLAPGVRVQFVTVAFDSLYDALLSGRCDVAIAALPHEPLRSQDVAYSMAYFNAGLALVVREGNDEVAALDDLAGRAVGVEAGFVPEGDARQRLFLQSLGLRRYDTPLAALQAAHAGEVEAALVDRISALAYVRDCGGLKIVGEPVTDVEYVIPLRPDAPRLRKEVDRVLLEMRQDGTLAALQEKWF